MINRIGITLSTHAKYVGVLRKTVRFTTTIKRSYRVLAVNPFGEPVASPWALLDVKC